MLAIRMQRTGRSGRATFRVIVQEARKSPTSGKVVALVGSYDPHSKVAILAKDKVAFYLEHGAQPSERTAQLLKTEGIKLPKWASYRQDRQAKLRHPDKLRRNRPAETAAAPAPAEPMQETAEPDDALTQAPEAPQPAPEAEATPAEVDNKTE